MSDLKHGQLKSGPPLVLSQKEARISLSTKTVMKIETCTPIPIGQQTQRGQTLANQTSNAVVA